MTKVLLFGENPNDTQALRELILGLCPGLRPSEVHVLREPPTLQRNAGTATVRTWVDRAAAALRAARVALGEAVCIFAHSDADAPDDGSFEVQRTRELREAGFGQARAVVPVESIEAWWLLFPAATESVVHGWRHALDQRPRDVERISGPKRELIRRTRAKQPKRPYRERDSPQVARAIARDPTLRTPKGSCASFARFVGNVDACCRLASS